MPRASPPGGNVVSRPNEECKVKNREVLLPLNEDDVRMLRAGDELELTGMVLTGRDQACARIFQKIQAEQELPVKLDGQLLYFVGPSPAKPGEIVGSAGPTTSGR